MAQVRDLGFEDSGRAPGVCISVHSLLGVPNELLEKILSYCSVQDIARLSTTCRKLNEAIGERMWALAVLAPSPTDWADFVSSFSNPKFKKIQSVVLSCLRRELLQSGLSCLCERSWADRLRFLMVHSCEFVDIGYQSLAAVACKLECLVLEGMSLDSCQVESFVSRLVVASRLRVFCASEQRHLALVSAPMLGSLIGSMVRVSLPLPGSTVDGITGPQIDSILTSSTTLRTLRLVSYWMMSCRPSEFEAGGLSYHLKKQREFLLLKYLKAASLLLQSWSSSGCASICPDIEHYCVISWGAQGVSQWCAFMYRLGGTVLSYSEALDLMEDLAVPESIRFELGSMVWTTIGRAEHARLEWITSYIWRDPKIIPAIFPGPWAWNSPTLGSYVNQMLPSNFVIDGL